MQRNPQTATAEPLYAALDLGTNNCRLLIAQPQVDLPARSGLKVVDSFSRIVRLGEGLTRHNEFSAEAMERTLEALEQCRRKLEKFSPVHARFVATEACRRAANSREFMAMVRQQTGLEIDIIGPEEEANLAFLGCASLLNPTPAEAVVFDIGGGSTEFMRVVIEDRPGTRPPILPHRVVDWHSLPHGVMNLSEKFGGASFAEVYFEEMVGYLSEKLVAFDHDGSLAEAAKSGQLQVLSTSGTVTTLAAITLGLPRYERAKIDGITLTIPKLREAIEAILSMRASERFNHPCIGSHRSDYIISGCAIFEAITRLWPVKEITIADRGVREGIIMSLIAREVR